MRFSVTLGHEKIDQPIGKDPKETDIINASQRLA